MKRAFFTVMLLLLACAIVLASCNSGGDSDKNVSDSDKPVSADKPTPSEEDNSAKPSDTSEDSGNDSDLPIANRLPSLTPNGSYVADITDNTKQVGTEISSAAAVLVNTSLNTVVASKEADAIIHPASMTKIMTLLVACENAKNESDLLTVTAEEIAYRKTYGASGLLGETSIAVDDEDGSTRALQMEGCAVSVKDALYLIIYQSDTVACQLIAKYIAGSEEAFAAMMNLKAQELGLEKTNFVNCTGLTVGDQYNTTTCREMAAIMAAALANPYARAIISSTSKYSALIYEAGEYTGYYIPSYPSWLARRLEYSVTVGKVVISGGKTGYEDIPTACFITYGKTEDGREFISVTVGRISASASGVREFQSTIDNKELYSLYVK